MALVSAVSLLVSCLSTPGGMFLTVVPHVTIIVLPKCCMAPCCFSRFLISSSGLVVGDYAYHDEDESSLSSRLLEKLAALACALIIFPGI